MGIFGRQLCTTVAVLVIVARHVQSQDCNICGEGNLIQAPQGVVEFEYDGVTRKNNCETWQEIVKNPVAISDDFCRNEMLRYTVEPCACTASADGKLVTSMPTSSPTQYPSPFPTTEPTTAPTVKNTITPTISTNNNTSSNNTNVGGNGTSVPNNNSHNDLSIRPTALPLQFSDPSMSPSRADIAVTYVPNPTNITVTDAPNPTTPSSNNLTSAPVHNASSSPTMSPSSSSSNNLTSAPAQKASSSPTTSPSSSPSSPHFALALLFWTMGMAFLSTMNMCLS